MSEVKYPKGERVWTGYYNAAAQLMFIITSKEANRDYYYLYEVSDDGALKKLGKARTPVELEEKFDVDGRCTKGSNEKTR